MTWLQPCTVVHWRHSDTWNSAGIALISSQTNHNLEQFRQWKDIENNAADWILLG